jgi:cell division protein ZipA
VYRAWYLWMSMRRRNWQRYELMDINVRDWMVIVGALLIVAVLLDGYRRMRNNASGVKVRLKPVPEGDDDGPVMRELPNGGARVVVREEGDEDYEDEDGEDSPWDTEPPLLTETGEQGRKAGTADLMQGLTAVKDEPRADPGIPPEVIMMFVTARDEAGFGGEDILQILLACELRFGEMDFFHRHEQAAGRGAIQFSVANMLQPGVFDIDAMSSFSTTGLTFFLSLPGPRDMMQAFEQMLETAECVAENLGGDLLDESRSAMTRQTLEHTRQRIRDLERRLLARP